MLRSLRKYGFIYSLFIKNSLMSQMEYRVNFLMGLLVETSYLFAKFLYVIIVYEAGLTLDGVPIDAILLFIGTYTLMTGIYWGLFAINFVQIPEHVRTGSLDILLTKPISLQFMMTLRNVDFGLAIPNVLGGVTMVVVGWRRLGLPADAASIGGFIFFLVLGLFVTYTLFLIPQLLSFWFIQIAAVNDISNGLFELNNMPMMIYSKWIQRIGIFIIPVLLITNFSPLFVLDRLHPGLFLWAILSPILLLGITRWIWSKAIRNYNSSGG
ncbi:ABC-2 family transporter protein [Paenibacillus sp. FSL P2-0089]|uniref:ABC transporter permease n=1 Tax=Paenibacillus sp. FSL P2-0089 TaxID=2954526 RepID=UPI003159A6BA